MNIIKKLNGNSLIISIEGRLDTTTSPELEAEINNSLNGITNLIFDFANLEYISSAGLRVILSAQKIMNLQGTMIIQNAGSDIMNVFEITGFSNIITFE